jgi:hypothetical protein
MFVKEVLNNNPYANAEAVNDAWQKAGFDGSISPTLVNKMRSQMGLAGNLRGKRRKRRKAAATANDRPRRGRPPKQTQSDSNGLTRVKTRGKKGALIDLELDLDRLLFRVMDVGNLPEVEDALRKARRLLYTGLASRS